MPAIAIAAFSTSARLAITAFCADIHVRHVAAQDARFVRRIQGQATPVMTGHVDGVEYDGQQGSGA